jgi:hypothetical protein
VTVETPMPAAFEHETWITFVPIVRATVLKPGKLEFELDPVVEFVTMQVVPAGIVVEPDSEYATLIGLEPAMEPFTGSLMTGFGICRTGPAITTVVATPASPVLLRHVTAMTFMPGSRATELVVAETD